MYVYSTASARAPLQGRIFRVYLVGIPIGFYQLINLSHLCLFRFPEIRLHRGIRKARLRDQRHVDRRNSKDQHAVRWIDT